MAIAWNWGRVVSVMGKNGGFERLSWSSVGRDGVGGKDSGEEALFIILNLIL